MQKRISSVMVGFFGVAVAIGFTAWNWHDLSKNGSWSMTLAFLMPVIAVVGVSHFLIERAVPGSMDQPFDKREPRAKKMLYIAIGCGALLGAINTYLMDRAFSARPLPPGSYRQY